MVLYYLHVGLQVLQAPAGPHMTVADICQTHTIGNLLDAKICIECKFAND